MPFQRGKPRPKNAGRRKGTPNKKTQDLEEIAAKIGVCPFTVLCLFAKGDSKALGYDPKYIIEPALRVKSASDAARYLYPIRKAVEVTGKDGEPIGSPQESSLANEIVAKALALLETKANETKRS